MTDWIVPLSDVRFTTAEVNAVAGVYRAGWLSQGPKVAAFERAFAEHVGAGHAVAVSSGTAALHLIYVGIGLQRGDEVILPSLTFAATAAAVVHVGATPVFADVAALRRPWLSRAAAEALVGSRTRAIVNVAYAGHPGEILELRELAATEGLALIEDAAHALSGYAGEHHAGTIGDAGAFSFYANKNMPLGEGGMLVTGDGGLAARARLLRNQGLSTSTWARHRREEAHYEVVEPGFNYRLDEARAALGLLMLGRVSKDNARRAALARRYAVAVGEIDGVDAAVSEAGELRSAWHLYPLLLDPRIDRSGFRARLHAAGVQTSVHYPPLHLSRAFATTRTPPLPVTEEYARRTVTVPLFPHMTDEQQARVITAISHAAR